MTFSEHRRADAVRIAQSAIMIPVGVVLCAATIAVVADAHGAWTRVAIGIGLGVPAAGTLLSSIEMAAQATIGHLLRTTAARIRGAMRKA